MYPNHGKFAAFGKTCLGKRLAELEGERRRLSRTNGSSLRHPPFGGGGKVRGRARLLGVSGSVIVTSTPYHSVTESSVCACCL